MTDAKTANARAQAPLATPDINSALCAAQARMPNAVFDKVNPHYKSKYASLASIRAATVPSLNAQGIAVAQPLVLTPEGNFLVRTELRLSGTDQMIVSEYPVAHGTPQAMGSNITYGRRQSLASVTCIAAEEDDDANAAEGAVKNGSLSKAERITAAQLSELTYLADEVSADKIKLCKYLNVNALAELPASRFKEAVAALESKRT